MEGPKFDKLEESELTSDSKNWKSIINKDSKSATEKNVDRTKIEYYF